MLVFLKLGGSLITNKDQPYTARPMVIKRAAEEIKNALEKNPDLRLVLGHGSGSFGHFAAMESGFNDSASTKTQWRAFQKVWKAARDLNSIVVEQFHAYGLPVISLPASAAAIALNTKIKDWNTFHFQKTLDNTLIPIIFGDTIIDRALGGVILSTEELFLYLVDKLQPDKIILAGKEPGIWADFPRNTRLISRLSSAEFDKITSNLKGSQSVDVTGGMQKKVQLMIEALTRKPDLSIEIISGEIPGNISNALSGEAKGTKITG